ncbi:putative ATP-dependent endonuclease of OLD family [Chitinophaga terrae (ex Kim and Jung 2007)]|uniref:ATP-dependent endonuclease n=1 Tax=Chitinophaga terrae (ex Kim and Jung 2007) TaxID=408074 RepID=UPI00277F9A6D|nr:AAA family ATPase [Chitinophaga terrae (ex Kim and Jung 2007)]MDQ0108487.1 putative ATP-dependent endonuclease of OLD family [Chitinophaga terrae (ex Kim and Jung 2007)]
MRINSVRIQNFRKLQFCKIDFSEKETIFVGANNSGKTTAMDALMTFLKTKSFKTQDFTLCHWKCLNELGENWIKAEEIKEEDKTVRLLEQYLPILDLWIEVDNSELHYVSHIIPTLDWSGGLLGIRLRFEPKDMGELIKEFRTHYNKSNKLSQEKAKDFKLWPKTFWDFCERKMNTYFTLKTYLLDPDKYDEKQELLDNSTAFEGDILKGLIKIDIINAQRGFSDVNSEIIEGNNGRNLSSQLRAYYDKHLNPTLEPTEKDIDALESINKAQNDFDRNLKESFKTSLSELERLNYPGFGNPQIQLSTKVSTSDGLQHDSAVKYYLDKDLSLPEKYNGLGYQNLISIIFKLIRFRDEWMRVGKNTITDDEVIEPLHLVLVEEPEAHLHAQVQQVFIKKAYDVLRNNKNLDSKKDFTTQLVISTHSSYIAHQKFESLRYFKRNNSLVLPTSEVISLKSVFGEKEKETEKFVIRYLNTTHNDIFFADAVILVEGPAERILVPHFIKNENSLLDSCYVTILEIGGSHAHRLKPLIETLGLICLIITDIDSVNPNDNGKKCQPKLGRNYKTNNDTLKSWHPQKELLDELLNLDSGSKITKDLPIRVAYQKAIEFDNGNDKIIVYPYTFEDALVLENKEIFKGIVDSTGLLKKMVEVSRKDNFKDLAEKAYTIITDKQAKKAEFALDVLYFEDPKKIKTPYYIKEGLDWVEEQLKNSKQGLVN